MLIGKIPSYCLKDKIMIENKVDNVEITMIKEFLTLLRTETITVCSFKNGKKMGADIISMPLLVFDFDDGTSVDDVISKVSQYRYVIAGSKNHLKDKNDGKGIIPRFHLFLFLSEVREPNPDFYRFLWEKCTKFVFKFNADKQAKDALRHLSPHSCILSVGNGKVFNVEPWETRFAEYKLREKVLSDAREEQLIKQQENSGVEYNSRLILGKKIIEELGRDSVAGSSGHNAMFEICCKLWSSGLYENDVERFAREYNLKRCVPQWKEKELLHKIQDAKKHVVKKCSFWQPNTILRMTNTWNDIRQKVKGFTE